MNKKIHVHNRYTIQRNSNEESACYGDKITQCVILPLVGSCSTLRMFRDAKRGRCCGRISKSSWDKGWFPVRGAAADGGSVLNDEAAHPSTWWI